MDLSSWSRAVSAPTECASVHQLKLMPNFNNFSFNRVLVVGLQHKYTRKSSFCHITVSDLDNCASELCILREWLEKILTLYEVAIFS